MKELIREIIEVTTIVLIVCVVLCFIIKAMNILIPKSSATPDVCCVCKESKDVIALTKQEEGKETEYKVCSQCIIKLIDNK